MAVDTAKKGEAVEAPKALDSGRERADVAKEGARQALGSEASTAMASGAKIGDAGIKASPLAAHDNTISFKPGDQTVGKYVASADAAQVKDGAQVKDATDRSTDKSVPTGDRPVVKEYSDTLQHAGMSKVEADKMAATAYDRFAKLDKGEHLPGSSPEEQMARINQASRDILDKKGVRDGYLANGQPDHLSENDRKNMVKDLAAREADPEKFVKQGLHMTCALESMQKQSLQGQDPAKVAEQIASITNNGFADVTQKDGTTRRVNIDSRSLAPDAESAHNFDPAFHGEQGKRGMAGQAFDALAGQLAADLKSERQGKPTSRDGIENAGNVYMAAHADQMGARPGQTNTGEGLFAKQADGSYKMTADNPDMQLWDVAHLNKAMGGQDGAVFASAGMLTDSKPPKGYPEDLKINTFHNTEELRKNLAEFQARTGQSGQLAVNAPFLPGGGENGHGMHAMNISLNADGSFKLNNNWAQKFDLNKVSDDAVDKATNPERWQPKVPAAADGTRPQPEPVPNDHTVFRPGSGRNPNESPAEADLRKQDDSWLKQLEDQRKKDDKARLDQEAKRKAEEQRIQEELDRQRLHGLNFYPE